MSVGPPYSEPLDFPAVDRVAVTPSVDDVALLCATRTIDTTGTQLGTFTDDTNPTDAQCEALIAQATTLVLAPLPDFFASSLYARVREAVALQAAILVETSFYREQANAGSVVAMTTALRVTLSALQEDTGGAGISSRVDSVVLRSTIADYDPYYTLPPPPVVGSGAAWAQPQPPTGPPQITSINPTGWSKGNQTAVIVSATGLNLQALPNLVAFLQDSDDNVMPSIPPVIDPSGMGTMLVATFAAPPPGVALGPGWFYMQLSGTSYGPLVPWEWVA